METKTVELNEIELNYICLALDRELKSREDYIKKLMEHPHLDADTETALYFHDEVETLSKRMEKLLREVQ